ncbi:MAG: hypothetical protein FWC38_08120 [Proteobacteria bacterium]|nr:hypothetical protein [Pseudomonadota bacterium]MCL2308166.1 hypothetical protein [Pseudomonadota bacterium]
MKKKGQMLAPRNPFALAARQRHAGAHDKAHKIKRRDDKQALRKLLRTEKDGDAVLFLTAKSHAKARSREEDLVIASAAKQSSVFSLHIFSGLLRCARNDAFLIPDP